MAKFFKHILDQFDESQLEASFADFSEIIPKDFPYQLRDIKTSIIGPGEWPYHTEKNPELYVVLSGQIIYTVDGIEYVLNAGDGILMEVGDSHNTVVKEYATSLLINFQEN